MKTCPACGFHHKDTDSRCARCSAALDADAGPDVEEFLDRKSSGWSAQLPTFGLERLWGAMGRRLYFLKPLVISPLPEDVGDRNPWLAAFLSLIPGAGQLYNHQPKKALLMMLGWLALAGLAAVTFFQPYNHYILMLFIVWMAYAFHDGLKTAVLINRQFWHLRSSLAAFCAWLFEIGVFFLLAQWVLSWGFLEFRYIGSDQMEPYLNKGDRVVVDLFSYVLRAPRRGEVVIYDPAQIKVGESTIIDPKLAIERVIAGPGETFERRGYETFLDGAAVGPEEGPIITSQITWNYKLMAPEDQFIIPFSYTGAYMNLVTISHEIFKLFGGNWRNVRLTPAEGPKLYEGARTYGWEEASTVERERIKGRVLFIYHPPERRRWIR